ncbi:hypothetical protein TBLA_0F00210 [Henningerozyma blattae CBS 6284]|uniref:Cell division control protein 50 n=1 Tax=Henningerozyma blattae (strain ATCC 34711 / CBS 6284 / DSM 70876 / NBRC 10599 / NRRL Y-10934 / UCD 77-7) TaxID=1071380 RepID=I2H5B3_HENB6|nr:hypothetical protein TBLA_0F00210 [Tetrapisispora blattae CBS 6284]CCH61565.1 hypothetical protein TBLA_0F00210 [Tetrapisispora blattae CBS 6284]
MRFLNWRRTEATNSSGQGKNSNFTHKSRRPPNTAFRQQRLKSWQPILSPQSVLPLLILMTCIFAPIGIGLIISTLRVENLNINYSHCEDFATNAGFSSIPKKYYGYYFKKSTTFKPEWKLIHINEDNEDTKICQLKFEIPNNIKKSILIYYKLTNFYQNHRKYVESFDDKQLKGEAVKLADLTANCKPLKNDGEKIIYPCGLIANSLFNDTFQQRFVGVNNTEDYELTNKKIAWKTDRHKFKKTKYNVTDIVPPPNWYKLFPNGYTDENLPDLSEWEEFQNWMRTAALPKFYKLILKNETGHLPKGQYIMNITLNYPVTIFGGSKSFVMTTNSIIGGRNIALSIVFIVVAGVSAIFALIFLIKVLIQPRSMGDHSYLNFANTNSLDTDSDNNNIKNNLQDPAIRINNRFNESNRFEVPPPPGPVREIL